MEILNKELDYWGVQQIHITLLSLRQGLGNPAKEFKAGGLLPLYLISPTATHPPFQVTSSVSSNTALSSDVLAYLVKYLL